MKRTIEIDDNLQETVEGACEELKEAVREWLDDNPDHGETPCLHNDIDYNGRFHEIIDGSVPVYYSDIDALWYLYKNDFIEAYGNAGVGDDPTENDGMAAIYYYLSEKVSEWYEENKEEIFEEWESEQKVEA